MKVDNNIIGFVVSLVVILIFSVIMAFTAVKDVQKITTVDAYGQYPTRNQFEGNNSQNATQLPLKIFNEDRWGQAPGAFGTVQTFNLKIGEFKGEPGQKLQQTGISEHTFTANSSYGTALKWSQDDQGQSTVTVTPETLIDEPDSFSDEVNTFNYDAISTWFKLKNAPSYSSGWQILTQIVAKMNMQSFQTFYYSWYCSANQFNDASGVILSLNTTLTNTSANTVYYDSQYGMSNNHSLTYWVAATLSCRNDPDEGCAGSVAWKTLQNYFASLSTPITLDNSFMTTWCGATSSIESMIEILEAKLMDDGKVDQIPISASVLACEQWARQSLCAGYMKTLDGLSILAENVTGMNDLGMDFVVGPEFTNDKTFSRSEAETLLAQNITDPLSLLNPTRLYNAYFASVNGSPDTSLNSTQNTALQSYLTSQTSAVSWQADGSLLSKSLNQSMALMNDTFLGEYAVRNLAYVIQYGVPDDTAFPQANCTYFIQLATQDDLTTAKICDQYNFNNLNDLRLFFNGTWFGDRQQVMDATNMTGSMLDTLYSTSDPSSFQSYLAKVCADEAANHTCQSSANCTIYDNVISLQWGGSNVTRYPLYTKEVNSFIPASNSMATWGTTWATVNVTEPPEFYAYMNVPYLSDLSEQFVIQPSQMNLLFSGDYSWYGLDNLYNAMHLVTEDQATKKTAYWDASMAQFGLTSEQGTLFLKQMRWHITTFLLGGTNKKYIAGDLIKGFKTTLTARVNTGDLLLGNLYVDDDITPIMNRWMGPTAGSNFTLMAGSADNLDGIGVIHSQGNNGPYLWMSQKLFNGTDFVQVNWYNEEISSPNQFYDANDASYSLYGYKFVNQQTPQISAYTNPKSIDVSSFSPYLLYYSSSGSYCTNAADIVCTQHFPTTQYSNQNKAGLNANRDKLPFNMPYTVMTSSDNITENSWSEISVDVNTGYSLNWGAQMAHSLDTSDNTFLFSFADNNPLVSIVAETNAVNMTAFLDILYPQNGTALVVNGTQSSTEMVQVANVSGIIILSSFILICIITAVLFIVRHAAGPEQRPITETLYNDSIQQEGQGLRYKDREETAGQPIKQQQKPQDKGMFYQPLQSDAPADKGNFI